MLEFTAFQSLYDDPAFIFLIDTAFEEKKVQESAKPVQ
jgi:hypothetical protein